MGTGRSELKVVAGTALLAVAVAVAGAVLISVDLSSKVDEHRSTIGELRHDVASMTDELGEAEDKAEKLQKDAARQQAEFRKCQEALELSDDLWLFLLEEDPGASLDAAEEFSRMAEEADKAADICLGFDVGVAGSQ